jgi:hypothetical protein
MENRYHLIIEKELKDKKTAEEMRLKLMNWTQNRAR